MPIGLILLDLIEDAPMVPTDKPMGVRPVVSESTGHRLYICHFINGLYTPNGVIECR